jgi:hypothetical protein
MATKAIYMKKWIKILSFILGLAFALDFFYLKHYRLPQSFEVWGRTRGTLPMFVTKNRIEHQGLIDWYSVNGYFVGLKVQTCDLSPVTGGIREFRYEPYEYFIYRYDTGEEWRTESVTELQSLLQSKNIEYKELQKDEKVVLDPPMACPHPQ